MKVTVVGAGNVGATVANVIAMKNFASEVVLLDIKEGIAEGKAMDMMQSAPMLGIDTTVTGVTNDYAATFGSKVIVVTSGIPRKPGMSREDLIDTNAKIVKGVVDQALAYSPDAIIIIISNPMDAMTYLTLKDTRLPRNRVIGLGGLLDSSRFKYYIAKALRQAGIPASLTDVDGMVIGGHPVIEDVVAKTKTGGATLTGLIGTSAWYAPGAAVATLVGSIVTDARKLIPCCVYLDGEYGEHDLCIGVPVILGAKGVERIVDVSLDGVEKDAFAASVQAARETNALLETALS